MMEIYVQGSLHQQTHTSQTVKPDHTNMDLNTDLAKDRYHPEVVRPDRGK